ncbi:MAG: nucleotidyltransferase domain-containing protein [Bacteroidales bacterium]|nr:nucleotidyltransferase domain-containing protein [Bacteroidales bacterium]
MIYSLNEYGLRQKDMDYMMSLFSSYPDIDKVVLYGSRAIGKFNRGSDVDLALIGKKITYKTRCRINYKLEEESPTLLWFDVLHYDTLMNNKLKHEIDRKGKVIFEKS